eukprot:2546525-Alexandrium_andersonii.AAC.1
MSASLVGSEMCIRDRRVAATAELRPRYGMLAAGALGLRPGLGGASWTVSYTHLTLPTICSV